MLFSNYDDIIDVDKLNEEIEKFGMVVDRMNDLPKIYEDVKIQLDVCREASNELKMTKEDMEKFMSSTAQTLDQQHKETRERIGTVEHNFEQKLDKAEVSLRDRISLSESNMTLSLNDLKHTIETATTELNQRLDLEATENKKRFIIVTVCVAVSIVIGIIKFFV